MSATDARIFLWAAFGTRDTPPRRLEVVECPVCRVLVPTAALQRHQAWHRAGGAR